MSFIQVAIGVDYRNLDAVHEADRVDAHLAISIAVIGPLDSWSVENPRRILKGDAVPADVFGVPGPIPREAHSGFIRSLCIYHCRDVNLGRAIEVARLGRLVRHDDRAGGGKHAAHTVADRDLGAGDLRGGDAAHLAHAPL